MLDTVDDCRKKLAYLRPEDQLEVSVSHRLHDFTKHHFDITVRCARQVWPAPWRRDGLTSEWLVGTCRTRLAAEKRRAALLGRIMRIRAELNQEH